MLSEVASGPDCTLEACRLYHIEHNMEQPPTEKRFSHLLDIEACLPAHKKVYSRNVM